MVALSGGADSTALLRLLAETKRYEVTAATVDHGLRPASREEAEAAGAWCRALGVPHAILTWSGPKPASALQEAARKARYALLAAEAARVGAGAIVVAHTADDQAETVFMRLARGSGAAGLSAMAPSSSIALEAEAPVPVLRPLLGVRRAELRQFLAGIGQPFHDDPYNDDPLYERVRTRALLGALEEQRLLTVDALCLAAARLAATEAEARGADDTAFRGAGGWFHAAGPAVVERPDRLGARGGLAARLIRAVSGAEHAPSDADAALALSEARSTGSATIGGALLRRHRERLLFLREPAAVLGRQDVAPSSSLRLSPRERRLWDGRFIVDNAGDTDVQIAPLGERVRQIVGAARRYDLPDEALATAPDVFLSPARVRVLSLAAERFGMGRSRPVMRFLKI